MEPANGLNLAGHGAMFVWGPSAHELMPRKRSGLADNTVRIASDSAEEVRQQASSKLPRLSLLVYHLDGVVVVPLRESAEVTIGREAPSDVVIADKSLSRQHARFQLRNEHVTVEDLSSTNGVVLNGARMQHGSLRPGDGVSLGSVLVTLHSRKAAEPALHGLVSHDLFCGVLDRELASAHYFHEPLALLMLRASDGRHMSSWSQAIDAGLRAVDLAAPYSEDVVELLLPRAPAPQALERARALASEHGLQVGIAVFPDAAASSGELVDACRTALRETTDEAAVMMAPTAATRAVSTDAIDGGLIVTSSVMRELFELVDRVASSPIAVLLLGETGSGKEVVARAIHERGPRADKPIICVNCGAIPPQLVESTLFGHERGAFTGANKASVGVFGAAAGGTVLLDEVGELPPAAQAALLRVLETKRVTRVGSAVEQEVDVRVLAATHRDLDIMCERGDFRRDLYYRLNAMVLEVPPLRERRDEIIPLARHFLVEATRANARSIEEFADEALPLLEAYDWPGNIRELKNAVDRAVVIARTDRIEPEDLPQVVRSGARPDVSTGTPAVEDVDTDLKTRVRQFEVALIERALREADGNQTEAARILKVPLRTFVHKLKSLDVKR